MALSVIGLGLGRTGTLSLKTALEQLGFGPCFHCLEGPRRLLGRAISLALGRRPIDWDSIFDGYNAAVDVPFSWFYRDIAEKCHSAKFILTVRNSNRWFESAQAMRPLLQAALSNLDGSVDQPVRESKLAAVLPLEVIEIRKFQDRESVIAAFERFNTAVQKTVAADRLLVLDVKQGWRPLCEFLGVPIPNEPFPHVNSTEEFPALLGRMVERESAK